jgi:hypothetical protein
MDVLVSGRDSIYVFDKEKVSVFSSALKFVRSTRIPVMTYAQRHVLANGSVLLGGALLSRRSVIATVNQIAFPFHLVDLVGGVRSFGRATPVAPGDLSPAVFTPAALSPDEESLWLTQESDYHLERWAIAGSQLAEIDVDGVPWLPPKEYEDKVVTGPDGRKITEHRVKGGGRVEPVHVDSAGRVWLLGLPRHIGAPQPSEANATFVLDVFDPVSRTFLASLVTPLYLRFFPRSDLAYSVASDADGIAIVTVYRVVLQRR